MKVLSMHESMATKPIYTQMLLILTYFVALIISLYQEVHYVLAQYIFNIVWRNTYSIRLFLIEAKHRYKGKNIHRKRTLKIYKVQKVYS